MLKFFDFFFLLSKLLTLFDAAAQQRYILVLTQVEGKDGLNRLWTDVKNTGPSPLYRGSLVCIVVLTLFSVSSSYHYYYYYYLSFHFCV